MDTVSSNPPQELPVPFVYFDKAILAVTEVVLVAIGMALTVLITTEVASRFILNYSISQVNASSQIMLVWFFLLGAGLAMREGGHVALDLLVNALSGRPRRGVVILSNLLVLVFFLQVMYGSVLAFDAARSQSDGTLGISMGWVMSAFPIGFALLIYHQAVTVFQALSGQDGAGRKS